MEEAMVVTFREDIPKIVDEYEGMMHVCAGVTDGTQSYVSDLLVDKKTGKKHAIVLIEKSDDVFVELLFPEGKAIQASGGRTRNMRLLEERLLVHKDEVLRIAKSFGIHEG